MRELIKERIEDMKNAENFLLNVSPGTASPERAVVQKKRSQRSEPSSEEDSEEHNDEVKLEINGEKEQGGGAKGGFRNYAIDDVKRKILQNPSFHWQHPSTTKFNHSNTVSGQRTALMIRKMPSSIHNGASNNLGGRFQSKGSSTSRSGKSSGSINGRTKKSKNFQIKLAEVGGDSDTEIEKKKHDEEKPNFSAYQKLSRNLSSENLPDEIHSEATTHRHGSTLEFHHTSMIDLAVPPATDKFSQLAAPRRTKTVTDSGSDESDVYHQSLNLMMKRGKFVNPLNLIKGESPSTEDATPSNITVPLEFDLCKFLPSEAETQSPIPESKHGSPKRFNLIPEASKYSTEVSLPPSPRAGQNLISHGKELVEILPIVLHKSSQIPKITASKPLQRLEAVKLVKMNSEIVKTEKKLPKPDIVLSKGSPKEKTETAGKKTKFISNQNSPVDKEPKSRLKKRSSQLEFLVAGQKSESNFTKLRTILLKHYKTKTLKESVPYASSTNNLQKSLVSPNQLQFKSISNLKSLEVPHLKIPSSSKPSSPHPLGVEQLQATPKSEGQTSFRRISRSQKPSRVNSDHLAPSAHLNHLAHLGYNSASNEQLRCLDTLTTLSASTALSQVETLLWSMGFDCHEDDNYKLEFRNSKISIEIKIIERDGIRAATGVLNPSSGKHSQEGQILLQKIDHALRKIFLTMP